MYPWDRCQPVFLPLSTKTILISRQEQRSWRTWLAVSWQLQKDYQWRARSRLFWRHPPTSFPSFFIHFLTHSPAVSFRCSKKGLSLFACLAVVIWTDLHERLTYRPWYAIVRFLLQTRVVHHHVTVDYTLVISAATANVNSTSGPFAHLKGHN